MATECAGIKGGMSTLPATPPPTVGANGQLDPVSATEIGAAERVFSILELFEAIVGHCTVKEVFRLQRVSKTCKANIDGSTEIQKKLFLKAKQAKSAFIVGGVPGGSEFDREVKSRVSMQQISSGQSSPKHYCVPTKANPIFFTGSQSFSQLMRCDLWWKLFLSGLELNHLAHLEDRLLDGEDARLDLDVVTRHLYSDQAKGDAADLDH